MGQMLRSWQEIATYVGKGLRTVQRWEREIDFPVHRSGEDGRHVVGFTDEINEWMRRSQPATGAASKPNIHVALEARRAEVEKLRQQVQRVREQAAILSGHLQKIRASRTVRESDKGELVAMKASQS